jgi:ribosomal protein S18 acetylase RimI-like enzyme
MLDDGVRQMADQVRIELWSGPQLAARVQEAMSIFVVAMNYSVQAGAQRGITTTWHSNHDGFACRAALTPDDTLVGFAYGYTTKPGQWWHDQVHAAIPAESFGWLDDAFELSEMHVLPEYQGFGLGRSLLTSLSAELAHHAILLSTPDRETRAFRLYRSLGFVDLARRHLFPGDARPFAILGAKLPLGQPGSDRGGQ